MDALIDKDFESSLIHFFPALDKTAKLRRPNEGVGARIKGFLADEEELISFITYRMVLKNTKFDGHTFPEAIYKFARTSIIHEGELDSRLTFGQTNEISIGANWLLPPSYIASMIVAVIAAKENKNECFSSPKIVNIHDKKVNANDLWGKKEALQEIINFPKI